ncbi:MAG: GAF domain-containing protein [Anaerolineae bacterium]|nr:GAF domain-containing protein [Anaerolineae bacterium]
MLAYAKKLFAPPGFPDDENKTRTARVLNTLVWSSIIVLVMAAIVSSTLFAEKRLSLLFVTALLVPTVVSHLLLRFGRVRSASLVFVSGLWATLTALIALAGGMGTAVASFYLVCAVFAGLLLGTRAALVISALSVLAGLGMVLAEQSGSPLPRLFPVPSRAGWADILLGLAMIIVSIGITLDSVQDALSAARRELFERKKAEEALKRRTEELEVLREAAQAMGASLDVNEILRLILDQLKRVLVYDTASVVIFREGNMPDLVVGLGFADEQATSQAAGKLLQGSPILQRMSRDLQPVVSPDVRQLDGWIWVPGAEHVRSWLGIPLVARDTMIGALMIDHSQPDFFGLPELQTAHSLARHAAQAIENARLYDETLRRNRELALLNRVIAASAAGRTIETILETACRELARAFDLARVAAVLFSRDKAQAIVVAEYQAEGIAALVGHTIPLDPVSLAQNLPELMVPRMMDDARTDPRLEKVRELFTGDKKVPLLILPLISEEELMGSLTIAAAGRRPFALDEMDLAQRVADQVSGALARIRLEDERRRLEEQFRQIQKMEALGRLAGGIAHDFNNLIAVIQLSSQMIERQLSSQDSLAPYVAQIRETGERATRLVHQLLSFSRRGLAEPRLLCLQDIVDDLRPMLYRMVGEDVELIWSIPRDLWSVRADPSQIEQVIVNLIVNARDAMPGGGTMTIELANAVIDHAYASAHISLVPGEYVLVIVSDTGVGMDEEVQAHIFEPFFTTKPAGKGTGLGLSIVFGIVTQSGGHIEVDSEVGQGTRFRIYLPRAGGT